MRGILSTSKLLSLSSQNNVGGSLPFSPFHTLNESSSSSELNSWTRFSPETLRHHCPCFLQKDEILLKFLERGAWPLASSPGPSHTRGEGSGDEATVSLLLDIGIEVQVNSYSNCGSYMMISMGSLCPVIVS